MVPTPARGQGDRWERWGRKPSPVTTATTRTSPAASGFGHATGLSCRECGKVYELGPHYACDECFGPLEVRYDYPPLSRVRHRGRPAEHVAVRAAAPGPGRHRRAPHHRARLHQADPRRQPRSRAGHAQALGQGRPGQPDAFVQGPGGRGGPGRRHRDGLQGARLPVHRQPGQRGGRRGGAGRDPLRGARARRPGAAEDHHHLGLRRHVRHRGRQLRRRQPAGVRARRRAAGLGVRQRQRPALLRRGVQDARLRGRRAARLAAARAGRRADRLGRAAGEGGQGLHAS